MKRDYYNSRRDMFELWLFRKVKMPLLTSYYKKPSSKEVFNPVTKQYRSKDIIAPWYMKILYRLFTHAYKRYD